MAAHCIERVALCDGCWRKRHAERPAARVIVGDPDLCHACGKLTFAGIYIHVDVGAEPAAAGSLRADELEDLRQAVVALRETGLRVMPEAQWRHLDGLDRFMHGTGAAGTRLVTPADGAVLDACAALAFGAEVEGWEAVREAELAARKERGARCVTTPAAVDALMAVPRG